MIRRLRTLVRDSRGAAVVELALIAPMLALLTAGVIDISNAYGRKLKIEQGAQRAIEKIMNTSAEDTIENTLAAEAASQAEVPLSQVSVAYRLECDGAVIDAEGCAQGQVASKWISVTVTDQYQPIFGYRFGGTGNYQFSAKAGVRIQ